MYLRLKQKIADRQARIGIIGLGYVGLPLVTCFGKQNFSMIGFDVDSEKVRQLMAGQSYIRHIPSQDIATLLANGKFEATDDFSKLTEADAIVICVPTPLSRHREPDLSYVKITTATIAAHLRPGQLIILESTTFPGTTEEIIRPILEKNGLKSGRDFFLAFSPEREDPGNPKYNTSKIPKVVGADDPHSRDLARLLYDQIIEATVVVSDSKTAEAVKITENIFRCVNIALVNELKMIYQRMGINIWEVIEAAKTKPFGFMPFYPGPGLGGHCIPIDPFYLTWKAREYDSPTRFVELAGEINADMPQYVVHKLAETLNSRKIALNGSRILVVGVSYKKDVEDIRESPAFHIFELLHASQAQFDYYDPFVAEMPTTREFPQWAGMKSIAWEREKLGGYHAALIITDHSQVDYQELVSSCSLVVDTRNATRAVTNLREKIILA